MGIFIVFLFCLFLLFLGQFRSYFSFTLNLSFLIRNQGTRYIHAETCTDYLLDKGAYGNRLKW